MKNNEKVLKIISDFQQTEYSKDAVHNILKEMYELYKFDKISVITEDVDYGGYITTFQYTLEDNNYVDFWDDENVNADFHACVLDELREAERSEFIKLFGNNRLIRIDDYESVKSTLKNVGFKDLDKNIESMYVGYILEGSFFGYITFENYSNSSIKLEEDININIFTILVNLVGDFIGKLELSKQLYSVDLMTNSPSLAAFEDFYCNEVQKNDFDYALCTIDIDKFKYINNIYGYVMGDSILKQIADVVRKSITSGEFFCRVNEDKFAFAMKYEHIDELNGRLSELLNNFESMRRMEFEDKRIIIVCGVTIIDKEQDLNQLMDQANAARKIIKGSHTNHYDFYDISTDAKIAKSRQIEEKMFDAIKNDEFVPFLQAKFDLNTQEICGAEALVRWFSKDGMIFPDEFIPMFEKNGFISVLDFVIYEKIMQHIREYLDKNVKVYPISLNVSRSHIKDSNFIYKIMDLINCYNIPKNLIELEVTESVFVEDKQQLKHFIDLMKERGLKVSIDDFGTAYSSLHILKDVNVDVIKIDKGFLDNIEEKSANGGNNKDKIVIKHIINMARELGFDIICEGIETIEQVELLKSIGCNLGQGYFFARPVPISKYVNTFYNEPW